jgi:hypothetical protein
MDPKTPLYWLLRAMSSGEVIKAAGLEEKDITGEDEAAAQEIRTPSR